MQDCKGLTALHAAAAAGHADACELLLAVGADAAARTSLGRAPLYLAVDRQHAQAVYVFVAYGLADNEARRGRLPAGHWAARAMRDDVLEERFQKVTRMVLGCRAAAGGALVKEACAARVEVVRLLLLAGAPVAAGVRNRTLLEVVLLAWYSSQGSVPKGARPGVLPLAQSAGGDAIWTRGAAAAKPPCETTLGCAEPDRVFYCHATTAPHRRSRTLESQLPGLPAAACSPACEGRPGTLEALERQLHLAASIGASMVDLCKSSDCEDTATGAAAIRRVEALQSTVVVRSSSACSASLGA